MNLNELNTKFGIKGQLEIVNGKGNLPLVKISNQNATAEISLYGAHILSYIPVGEKETMWMSPKSFYETGKPYRGGIPVCFPWFGSHATLKGQPSHGFVRLNIWNIVSTKVLANGETEVVFSFESNKDTLEIFPSAFKAEVRIIVGSKLDVKMTITNTSKETFTYSDAFHTYFNVGDISKVEIEGLKDCTYYAGFEAEPNNVQKEAFLKIEKEENRRYINQTGDCVIIDKAWNRKIRVAKKGSKVTVVWNPWSETIKTMSADMPEDGYKTFVCVEAINYYDNVVTLKPNESESISTIISVEK